ncbi:hypothetical protein FCULG_00007862 [Fusarium culmorum]|uniref:14-3-3 domain-containing protein n=1 Tax=Fusarium culmorum TaxID=5516 RepID=A0A2T4H063_FUSCU|nr:hypothetical protein FCULG_00007862 [Fusarium culmorum]
MASSEVDQKFLGKLAKAVENDNPLLANMLFKILGLSLNLAEQLVAAKKQRRPDYEPSPNAIRRVLRIIWLSREGKIMLEQYVLPMVGNYVELKVLAYKLRASFSHIFALFGNLPSVSHLGRQTPDVTAALASRMDKGKGRAADLEADSRPSRLTPRRRACFENIPLSPNFLIPAKDYLPEAKQHFQEAIQLADSMLWGSHSLRLSVKTEYAAFLYECAHDAEGSRKVAKDTIAEVYEATEGMDDDMFGDACELVTVLGKMMKRGLGTSGAMRKAPAMNQNLVPRAVPPPGMENPI